MIVYQWFCVRFGLCVWYVGKKLHPHNLADENCTSTHEQYEQLWKMSFIRSFSLNLQTRTNKRSSRRREYSLLTSEAPIKNKCNQSTLLSMQVLDLSGHPIQRRNAQCPYKPYANNTGLTSGYTFPNQKFHLRRNKPFLEEPRTDEGEHEKSQKWCFWCPRAR